MSHQIKAVTCTSTPLQILYVLIYLSVKVCAKPASLNTENYHISQTGLSKAWCIMPEVFLYAKKFLCHLTQWKSENESLILLEFSNSNIHESAMVRGFQHQFLCKICLNRSSTQRKYTNLIAFGGIWLNRFARQHMSILLTITKWKDYMRWLGFCVWMISTAFS